MNTALLEKEQPAMVELFPPEETIPVNFDADKQMYFSHQCATLMNCSAACTTRCGPIGSFRTCGC